MPPPPPLASPVWERPIFTEMTALAVRTGAINLGQGFPDTDGPAAVIEAAVAALRGGENQYAPLPGVPALREAIFAHQRRWYGLEPEEVLVTFGATEAIASAVLGLCDPGDEVVVLEPYYDSYAACVAFAGATRRPVTLRPPDFALDPDALRAAIEGGRGRVRACCSTRRTTRPAGCSAATSSQAVADACIEHDLVVHHRRGLRAPRLRRRARPAGDAARDGRADADDLQRRQVVLGHRLEDRLVQRPGRAGGGGAHGQAVPHLRRRHAAPACRRRGAGASPAQSSTHCATTCAPSATSSATGSPPRAWRPSSPPARTSSTPTWGPTPPQWCATLPERCGIVAIPTSVFYDDKDAAPTLVRFAFCKRPEVIAEAARRLAALR